MASFIYWRDYLRPRPRPYVRKRTPLDPDTLLNGVSDEDCIDMFRLDKEGIEFLTQKLASSPYLARKTRAGLPVKCQLLVALKYYATGCFISGLKNICNMKLCASSVVNCITNVSMALAELSEDFLSFPLDKQTILNTKDGFQQYGGFPACIGAIDGTHIQIKPPSVNEEIYVGRKGFHSINVQVVCDHNLMLTDVVVKWPGSTHDTAIYNLSGVKDLVDEYLNSSGCNGWLIGDSGYPLRPSLMVPLSDPQTPQEIAYNKALVKCRNSVERCLGVLKSRFRVLDRKSGGGIQYHLELCGNVILACCVLHNYCRMRNMDFPVDTDTEKKIREDARLKRFNEPELKPANETEKQELKRGERLRQRVIDSF